MIGYGYSHCWDGAFRAYLRIGKWWIKLEHHDTR